jgi:ferredoxin-NADP reductase
MGEDFDATGHLSRAVFDEVGVPREADVYLCGPTRFMSDMKEALAALGVPPERIHAEIFNGSESMTPRVVRAVAFGDTLPFCSLVELRTRFWSFCSSWSHGHGYSL